ncbi:Pvc16 family protein, partial [Escherichia coli]|uniref:Pvc16 family protein n=1 Tax=Escherichia coli TaxID=562 RepID=UPI0013D7382A
PGARVTTLNPGSEALRTGDPFVNLYLFRTTRNGFVSNNDLPTRGPLGRAKNSPVLKPDLDYMITFFGDDARLDPQRLLGLVAGGLNAEPYI